MTLSHLTDEEKEEAERKVYGRPLGIIKYTYKIIVAVLRQGKVKEKEEYMKT